MGPVFADVLGFMVLVAVAVLLLVGFLWGMSVVTAPKRDYVAQCTIENKTLPRPDLYCGALWTQAHDGKGGR